MSTTALQSFIHNLRQQIVIGEISLVLDQLQSYLGDRSPQLRDEVMLLTARYNRINRDQRKGLLTQDAAQAQQNQLTQNLLDFLEEIISKSSIISVPTPSPYLDSSELTLPADVNLEKILGVNNLKQIAWLEQGLTVSRCVCRLLTPKGLGTGFLITPDRLMTNHHVIPDVATAAETVAEFNYQQDLSQNPLLTHRYQLDSSYFQTDPKLDYTLVGITSTSQKTPLEAWGHVTLNPHADPIPGEHVVIIQHPNGGLKQIALTANQVLNTWEYRLHYTTDTMPGSSGAPVFNDRWEVIAIHHAGGNLQMNAQGQKRFINEGILISAITTESAF